MNTIRVEQSSRVGQASRVGQSSREEQASRAGKASREEQSSRPGAPCAIRAAIRRAVRASVRPSRRHRSGMAIVEFAVGSGVLLAVFSGTFEVGYSLIQYNQLEMAVAQGARYASIVPYDSATATPSAAFRSAVQNMVLYGSPAAGTSPVLSGLSAENVNVTVTFANGVPDSIHVSISGYTINALFGTYTLTGKPQVTYPYQGVWAPV